MLREQTVQEKILNAITRVDYYGGVSDGCALYVELEDGSFAELLANSPETGNADDEDDELLTLGHLKSLFTTKDTDS